MNGLDGPVQVPVVVVKTWPTVAVPDTAGRTVLAGELGVKTRAVALESCGVFPQTVVAVIVDRMVLPESAATSV